MRRSCLNLDWRRYAGRPLLSTAIPFYCRDAAAPAPKTARLLKRLQKVAELPAADQRTVLKLVDALHAARQREHRRPRAAN